MTEHHGYPCANFAISGSVSVAGRLFPALMTNPGTYGANLKRWGGGGLRLHLGDALYRDEDLQQRRVERAWPFAQVALADPRLGRLQVEITAFAPLAAGDGGAVSGLPLLVARLRLRNPQAEALRLGVEFALDAPLPADWFVGWGVGSELQDGGRCDVEVAAWSQAEVWLLISHYDADRLAALRFADARSLALYAAAECQHLLAQTRALEERLPRSGRPVLDSALRWNTSAAVILTRLHRDGGALTMGYQPLNQRDSFWTSYVHLLLWPELDRQMIACSIREQRSNGKIPTCIMPEIEREVDIDINAYFVLRVTRHLAVYPDRALAQTWLPAVVKALDFLASLDDEDIGLPYQRTFWGDWKDVAGVSERSYAPHACLIAAAAWRAGAQLAAALDQQVEAQRLEAQAARALQRINLPFAAGGLWNGHCYQQRWRDGRDDGVMLLDQTIAGLFGVIDAARLRSIWQALDAAARTPFGVSETWPWYPASFGYQPGHYHNGGIWPWLSYADAWCRLAHGSRESGLDLLAAVAWADLERDGDYQPHEYLAADSGAGCGFPIQGWNAAFFPAVYYGCRGLSSPQLPTSF